MKNTKFKITSMEVEQEFYEDGCKPFGDIYVKKVPMDRSFADKRLYERYMRFLVSYNKRKVVIEQKNGQSIEKKIIHVGFNRSWRNPSADLSDEIKEYAQMQRSILSDIEKSGCDISFDVRDMLLKKNHELQQKLGVYSKDYMYLDYLKENRKTLLELKEKLTKK